MKFYKVTADRERVYNELNRIGVDPYALKMADKGEQLNIVVTDLKSYQANMLKQEALASGIDVAVNRGVLSNSIDRSDIMIMGELSHYSRLIKRLEFQRSLVGDLGLKLDAFLHIKKADFITARREKITVENPLVMGILNCTPDSFSDRSGNLTDEALEKKIDEMLSDGADIIDIGGASSRPNADDVSYEVEVERIKFALSVANKRKALISIDSNNYQTAKFAITHGAKIVNDINGLTDDKMVRLVADSKVAVVIMHKRGNNSKDMQNYINYNDLLMEMKLYFSERIEKALKFGVDASSIILDVGFGFSKTFEQNIILLKYLSEFKSFGLPILAGVSNKSMIGVATGREVQDRLFGTISANSIALMNGADIIRTHDVKAGSDTVRICNAVAKS